MSAAPETIPSKTTTMAALKPAEQTPVQNLPAVSMGFASLQSFELMQRAAKLLMASSLVPQAYQSNLPNCVIALNMAQRLGADPLMVMQNLYVVYGRPSWSAQFLIACFNQCGRFSAIRYKWSGTPNKDDWTCQAYARELDSGEAIFGPEISISLAKKEGWYAKNGSKWQTIPQLMLMYRAAAWLVRTHAPELSMGLQTQEEMHDVLDARRGANGEFSVTTDELRHRAQSTLPEPPKTEDWIKTITAQTVLQDLEGVWMTCQEAFGGSVPDECTHAYEAKKEALGEQEGKQAEEGETKQLKL